MDFEKLHKMVRDPRFISGIYNYCDRWCERCEFTTRCLTYVSVEDNRRELDRRKKKGIKDELPEETLPEPPPLAEPNIQQDLKDAGLDEDEEDFKEFMEQEERAEEEARDSPIGRAGWTYAEKVTTWLEAHRHLFNNQGELVDDAVKAKFPGVASEDELLALQDAIETIRWYHVFIHVKSQRALLGQEDEDIVDDDGTPFPRDSDGSAKVCLLGIDRSIEAWSTLRDLLPKASEGVLDTLTLLNNLRHAIEEEFPNARAFVRAGFDEPLPPALPKRKRTPKQKGPRSGGPKRRKGDRGPRGKR